MDHFILSGFSDEIHENFTEQLNGMKALGISYIEIRGVNGKNITAHTLGEVEVLKRELDSNGIKVSAIGSPIGKIFITEDFEPHIELFKHTIAIAKVLGTKYIRMFSFFIPKGKNPEDYADEVLRRLKVLATLAEEEGAILLHENEKDIYGDIPLRVDRIIKTINSSHLKLTFDFANFVQVKVDPREAYELLKEAIEYFHIKDARLEDGTVVPAGHGDGHIFTILKDARENGYHGFASLEPHLGVFKGLKDLELDLDLEEVEENGFEKFKLAHSAFTHLLNNLDNENID